MMNRLTLLRITIHQAWALFFLPLLTAYIVIPAVAVAGLLSGDIVQTFSLIVFAFQALLPVSGCLWEIALLQMWTDHSGEEAMRACEAEKQMRMRECVRLSFAFIVSLLPLVIGLSLWFPNIWSEYARVSTQILLFSGAVYLIIVLIRSIAVSVMVATGYQFYCVLFCRYDGLSKSCLVRPDVEVQGYEWLLLIFAASFYLLGMLVEKRRSNVI